MTPVPLQCQITQQVLSLNGPALLEVVPSALSRNIRHPSSNPAQWPGEVGEAQRQLGQRLHHLLEETKTIQK